MVHEIAASKDRIMNGLEIMLAALSLMAAYGGSFIGDRLLDRFSA